MTGPRHADQPAHAETAPLNPDSLEVAPGTIHDAVQGWVPELATEDEVRVALEKAFDYRGDVALTTKDGRKIEGYIFDRVSGPTLVTRLCVCFPRIPTSARRSLMLTLQRLPSRAVIPLPERVGKPGSVSTGKRSHPARPV